MVKIGLSCAETIVLSYSRSTLQVRRPDTPGLGSSQLFRSHSSWPPLPVRFLSVIGAHYIQFHAYFIFLAYSWKLKNF